MRILPYDESFVQGVEALTAKAGGVDGTGFVVSVLVWFVGGFVGAWGGGGGGEGGRGPKKDIFRVARGGSKGERGTPKTT